MAYTVTYFHSSNFHGILSGTWLLTWKICTDLSDISSNPVALNKSLPQCQPEVDCAITAVRNDTWFSFSMLGAAEDGDQTDWLLD